MEPRQLKKSHNHSHFWVKDNCVYESYKTIRGIRFREIVEIVFEDKEKLNQKDIRRINIILVANYVESQIQ